MIKKIVVILLLISSVAQASSKIQSLSAKAAAPFVPPRLESVLLSNGIRCFLFRDATLPMLQGKLYVKGGTVFEEANKIGAGSVMANLLKDGGTVNRTPDEVRGFLDENAIDISFAITSETIDGYFGSLSKDTDKALDLFFEMAFQPAFDEESLSVSKKRIMDALRRDEDTAAPIAGKEFRKLIYGSSDPWGRYPEPADIKKITRADVAAFHERFFQPSRMILAIAGDFNKKELLAKLAALAKKYPQAAKTPELEEPSAEIRTGAEEKFIKKAVTQSAIDMGHAGSTRDDPAKFALVVMNDILGGSGSFSDRLKQSVRVKGGLAYEVWSSFGFGPANAPGMFMVHVKTRNESVDKAIDIIKVQIKDLVDNGATKEELERAKTSILNSLIFEYEKPFGMVSAVARFVYFGYPENYIQVYKRGIERVTLKDVNEAANKYLHPDDLKIVVVGKNK